MVTKKNKFSAPVVSRRIISTPRGELLILYITPTLSTSDALSVEATIQMQPTDEVFIEI